MIRPSSLRLRPTPDRLAALLVTLAPLAYFHAAVRGLIYLSPEDGMTFNVPLRVAAATMMREGFLPLWNPYIFSGMPLHASAQAGVLFPLNWFYLFFAPPTATNLMVIGGYMAAALGAYLYARRAGSSIIGAVFTSLVWQWSGFLVGQLSHVNIVQTAAMLPWLLWAVDGYGAGGKKKYGLAVALFVCLQAFTGHQQTLAYSLLLAGAYAVCMARASRAGEARTRYLSSLLLIALGVALAAVQILPTLELLRNSVRSEASYDFFSSFSLPPRLLWTFVAPYVFGGGDKRLFLATYVGPPFYGEFIGYVGALTLSLAALALVFKRDTLTKFWAAAALVCLALALGRHWPFNLYAVIYHVPVLNLFRVPARHMMEVDFALAFLAGRGVTAVVSGAHERARLVRWSLALGGAVTLLACLAVTVGRPADLKLGRTAPVSVMRAPELFLPVLLAALSAWALYLFARSRGRGASTVLLLAVLALDLCLWGQSSGWRTNSPPRTSELWNVPQPAHYLLSLKHDEPYRILTYTQPFDPRAYRKASPEEETEFFLSLQPDTYMPHRLHNAAGYDGFGLARYSRLADDMKVWGDLVTPERSVHGAGREFDLLNVRYLIAKRPLRTVAGAATGDASSPSTLSSSTSSSSTDPPTSSSASPSSTSGADAAEVTPATQRVGGELFAAEDLPTPYLERGARLFFNAAGAEADRFVLLTNLSWSVGVTDGAPVGTVRLRTADNRTLDFELRAGEHTSEWAYDRADIRAQIKHRRALLGTSYPVADPQQGNYEGHTYVAAFALPARARIASGEISVAARPEAPNLSLKVFRASFVDTAGDRALALRSDWLTKDAPPVVAPTPAARTQTGKEPRGKTPPPARERDAAKQPPPAKEQSPAKEESAAGARWRTVAQFERLGIYENTRRLPRAWLAHGAAVLPERPALDAIRTGKLPGGDAWEPRRTALLEAPPVEINLDGANVGEGRAEVTRYEPNRVDVKTASAAPAVLVLADNHYPGWRARLDGREVALLRVNYNLRGVALPPGEHHVSFVYRPTSLLAGLAVSLAAAALLALWTLRRRVSGKNRRQESEIRSQKSEEA